MTSTSEFSATLFYAIAGVGNVGVLPSPEAKAMKVFTYVGEGTDTGFAVANPSVTVTSTLTFQIYNAEGQLQREETLPLGPNEHRAFFFSEPPYSVTANGSVTVLATEPVVAVALRLDGSFLSGVGVVVPGLPIRGEWTGSSPNIIGGYGENRVREGEVGGTIGGGGSVVYPPDHPIPVGGGANFVTGSWGTVGGGLDNSADFWATVSGGAGNNASGWWSAVDGGEDNTASGEWSVVVGGLYNIASGELSTVVGGYDNRAIGDSSLAAGQVARARHEGTFVWSDASDVFTPFISTAPNQFLIRATNGVGINTDSPQAGVQIEGTGWPNSFLYLNATDATGDSGIRLMQQGTPAWHAHNDSSSGDLFRLESNAHVVLTATQAGNVGIRTTEPQGALDVNGSIYQRGSSLHADYVFDPDYKLESIEEHSLQMWAKKHLPALQSAAKDAEGREVVEYGSRMRGMLEELEKAHVYIEQLNARLAKLEAMLEKR